MNHDSRERPPMHSGSRRTEYPVNLYRQAGVTLIEILIAIVILAILSTIGVPSFLNAIRDTRLTSQADNLASTLRLARSEAIKANADVKVVAKTGGWSAGWEIRDDANALLRVSDALGGGNVLSCKGGCSDMKFNGAGLVSGGASKQWVLCDPRNAGREVTVRITGGVRVSPINDGGCPHNEP